MDNKSAQGLMFLPLTKKVFDIMFDTKADSINPVLKHYDVSREFLHDMLWKEFNIESMETRIANTALDFLIDCCEEKKDLCKTLKGEIKKNILAAAIFYTNIAPEAAFTSDFKG